MDIKKFDIILTEMAKKDLEEIYEYIYENLKEPKIADRLMRKIEKEILSLEISPYRYMKVHIKPRNDVYRRLIIENYIVLYKVNIEDGVVIVYKILYGGMDYLK